MYTQESNFVRRERKPTRQQRPLPPVDMQAMLPLGWCVRCGAEIFHPKSVLCERCKRIERRSRNVKRKKSKSLSDLYQGS